MGRPPADTDREAIRHIIREALCLNGTCKAHEGVVERIMERLEPIIAKLDDRVYAGWESAMGDDL